MRVHYELAGAGVGKDLGPLQNPVRTQMLRICEYQYLAPELPVHQIARQIAGNVAFLRIVGLRPVLTEPVVRALRSSSTNRASVLPSIAAERADQSPRLGRGGLVRKDRPESRE